MRGLSPLRETEIPFYDLWPSHQPLLDDLERAFRSVTRNSGFVGGSEVELFEQEWAEYCGTRHAVGVANGTDALELTLRALGIGCGDEVIMPANTFVATAEAVVAAGATPRFADVDPATLLLNADNARQALGTATAAIIVVHLYGQPADMDELRHVATAAGVALIEDAAQAHGARWSGRPVGGLGTAGTFSFYPSKNLGALGDAGCVVTNDTGLADRVRSLGNHGRADSHTVHERCGRNSRLDALQAALLRCKLKQLGPWNLERAGLVDTYRRGLTQSRIRLVKQRPEAESSHHLLVGLIDDRDEVRLALAGRGVHTGVHYPVPCHRQPAFAEYHDDYLPIVERAAARVISLPLYPGLEPDTVDAACEAINHVLESRLEATP